MAAEALDRLLHGFSVEIIPSDKKSLESAQLLPAGTEVFVASTPKSSPARVIETAVELRKRNLRPVPHLAARRIESAAVLDDFLARATGEAAVDRVLVIGGDKDVPAGEYESSLKVLQAGLLQKHGVKTVYLACYPEGHPRIGADALAAALRDKLAYVEKTGLRAGLVSQFCFEAEPIVKLAKEIRDLPTATPFRPGVAGPANHATLLGYAMKCGVGASIRALRDRGSLLAGIAGNTAPDRLLHEVAAANQADSSLGMRGVHFFTFGSLGKAIELIAQLKGEIQRARSANLA
jgi:methylenetetrahydrofolate reductase (NADPH)